MIDSPLFMYAWCAILVGCGLYLLYLEWLLGWTGESDALTDDTQVTYSWFGISQFSGDNRSMFSRFFFIFRFFWFILGVYLIILAGGMATIDNKIVAQDLSGSVWALSIGIGRILWCHFLILRPNKHKFFVGDNELALRGERGVITQNVSLAQSGMMHLGNPAFGKDDLDCVSEEQLNVGDRVEIVKTECGLVTVQKITHS